MGLTRVANVTGLDHLGIPVYMACRPNARSLAVAQGKGYTADAAKVSAVMESIESYHAENIDLPLKLCSYNELFYRENCIDVYRLPRLINSKFTPNERLLWMEGLDLFSRANKWLPYETVHVDYRAPLPTGHGCFIASSNGLASGNSYHEAVIHGLCEVIERDALTLWSLKDPTSQQKDKIDPSTIDDPRCKDIIERFMNAGIDIGIWDITNNSGIPAFLCRILPKISPDISGMRSASGMGCHLSKHIALLRALTEAAQSRLTFISGARDDMTRAGYEKHLNPDEYMLWHKNVTEPADKDYAHIDDIETATFDEDLNLILGRLKHIGIAEAIVVDLSKEEFGIPVTKVVVPGLESFLGQQKLMVGQRAGRILQHMTGGADGT